MPTKTDARKAAKTAYKRTTKQADLPDGYTLASRLSEKRAKVCSHTQKPDVIIAHRGTQGWHDKLTDITAVVGGKRRQNKRFQHAQAVTNRVRVAYPQAHITAVGHSLGETLAQDSKGSDKQIAFNKGTSLPDVVYRRHPKSQIDYRKTGDVIPALTHLQRENKLKRSGKWPDPFRAHNFNLKRHFSRRSRVSFNFHVNFNA
jgi:hypothetical protein